MSHSLARIFQRFFPRKNPSPPIDPSLPPDEMKELADQELTQGELSLLQNDLSALSHFETASQLDPHNPQIWYRQGLAFFEYGSEEGKEKALLLASKYFKIAVSIDPNFFEAWTAWGNVLLQLGKFHEEHHFLLESRDKYKKAIELAPQSGPIMAELQWDFGVVWMEIGAHSGEALDYHLAIQAFQSAATHESKQPPEFWHDYGSAYLELGLLINDERMLLQAVEELLRSVHISPNFVDGWHSLGSAYSELYQITMDERFATKASDCYSRAARLSPREAEIWLNWGKILCETGRFNKNVKPLISSVEKCAKASTLDTEDTDITCQWVESLSYLGALAGRVDLLIEAEKKIIAATDQFPDDPDLWKAYGICLMSFARYYEEPEYDDLAVEKLQYGLSLDRTHGDIWHTLGQAHKHCADLTDEEPMIERSVRFFAKAIDFKPNCPALIFDSACAELHKSEAFNDLDALTRAIGLFESLLQNHRNALLNHPEWLFEYASALQWLGECSGEEKDFARALEVFSHVVLIDPDFPKLHLQTAYCHMEMGHALDESEYYKRALHHFRLAVRQDEENDKLWLDWGVCLIHLAHHTIDAEFMDQLYLDAEQKITKAGQLGNPHAHYHLACLYSILGQTVDAMALIRKALQASALPPLEELLEDEWLENLRDTEVFGQFITALEEKLQTREQ